MKEKEEKVDQILEFAKKIVKRKTYRQVIKGIKEEVPKLLGFTEIGLLFYDKKSKKKCFELI